MASPAVFFTDEGGNAYGELETGATRLAFASLKLAREHLGVEPLRPDLKGAPLSTEIAFTCAEVPALYERALKAGGQPVSPPAQKPWGQVVAYLRDPDGYLVELCTPLG